MENSIQMMIQRLSSILMYNIPSIYLFGSVVMGDFKLGWSDIDIACFLEEPLTKTQAEELLVLRQSLLSENPGNQYYRSFEGIITTWDVCLSQSKGTVVYWGTSRQRIMDSFTIDTFSKIELIKFGRLLYGDDKIGRIELPTHYEIHKAVIEYYNIIRKHAVKTNEHLYSAGWLLDIARCLYTLKTDDVISKTEAGKWAIKNRLTVEPDILNKAVMIRENPSEYKNDTNIKNWLASLGPHIQLFANVLEDALI